MRSGLGLRELPRFSIIHPAISLHPFSLISSISPPGGSTSPFSSPITSDEEYLSPPEEFPEPGEAWPRTPTMKLSPSQDRDSSDSKAPPTFKVRPLRLVSSLL